MSRSFESLLFKMDMKGGWTLAPVPAWAAPTEAGPWGRTPIRATVDGRTWDTSVWRDKHGQWVLPVPKWIRKGKEAGDTVVISLGPR